MYSSLKPQPLPDFTDASAVLIRSKRLGCDLWLAFDHSFVTNDNVPVFYTSELPILARKSQAQLNGIVKTKLVFSGSVVES